MDPLAAISDDLCFSLAAGQRRVDLIANSQLEKQALKQVRGVKRESKPSQFIRAWRTYVLAIPQLRGCVCLYLLFSIMPGWVFCYCSSSPVQFSSVWRIVIFLSARCPVRPLKALTCVFPSPCFMCAPLFPLGL